MLTHVFEPIKIGKIEIKNRVFRPAHGTSLGGLDMNERLFAYHEARARGGVGLTILEIMGVHYTSPTGLSPFIPAVAERMPRLVERIKPYGMKLFQQLWHGGQNGYLIDGTVQWSSSDIPSPWQGIVPIPMTKGMIDEVVESYAESARKCEQWGLDGVEVHCAHGYLPQQFLSTSLNKRTDDYGGSFENRARFMMDVLTAVRKAVSPDFVVGIRVAPDNAVGGMDSIDTLRAAQTAEARGLVDFVNVSMGSYHNMPKMIGGMHEPVGYELATSTPVTREIKVPTMVVGRFRTLEEADQAIRAGDADLVGFVRATIADPDLVVKTMRGDAEQVRPCIACNQGCVGQVLVGGVLGCAVNPSVGFETELDEHHIAPTKAPKRVAVVGGGPAGLEAARVAALQGHKVTLFEAQPRLGGALRIAAMAPKRHGIFDIVTWLEAEVFRLGVDVRLSTYVSASDIAAEEVDAVILATGSTPRVDGVQANNPGEPMEGADSHNVISSWDVFLDTNRNFGKSAVVVDDVGHFEALAVTEQLLSKGMKVNFVTRNSAVGHQMDAAYMTEPSLQRMAGGDITFHTRSRAVAARNGVTTISPTYLPRGVGEISAPADTVVLVTHNRANRELYMELAEMGLQASIVGDANAPRFLVAAIAEGHRAARALSEV